MNVLYFNLKGNIRWKWNANTHTCLLFVYLYNNSDVKHDKKVRNLQKTFTSALQETGASHPRTLIQKLDRKNIPGIFVILSGSHISFFYSKTDDYLVFGLWMRTQDQSFIIVWNMKKYCETYTYNLQILWYHFI